MKIGTKSLLFGVHQFLVHPIVVGRAWRALYGKWPDLNEWIAIVVHDLGYWGCPNMDGPEGKLHPGRSSRIAYRIARVAWKLKNLFRPRVRDEPRADVYYAERCARLVLFHSREMVKLWQKDYPSEGIRVSPLCWPDKYSVCFEWTWFYLLRAKLSGEIHEFRENAVQAGRVPKEASLGDWFEWYCNYTYNLPQVSFLRRERMHAELSAWIKENQ